MRRIFRLPSFRSRDVKGEVEEEIAFHIAMRESQLRAQGVLPADAAGLARSRFGDVAGIRDECLEESHRLARWERIMQGIEEAGQDARYAVRALLRAPGFAVAVIVTLALGIGASTTIFSLIQAVILRPVRGVPQLEQLFALSDVSSYPVYRELRDAAPALGLSAFSDRRIALGDGASAQQTQGAFVSGNYFALLGVHAALGRVLADGDDVSGVAPVGVLAFDYWNRQFAGDASIIGRTVTVNGAPVTVVGVAARDFRGLHLGTVPSIWLTLHAFEALKPSSMRSARIEDEGWTWLSLMGRVPAGSSEAQVASQLLARLSAVARGASEQEVRNLIRLRSLQAAVLPTGAREAVVRFSAILAAVIALVLLTACANIAGLLLSRAAYREREIAVRVALGAGRWRLARQLLTEALVLALAGGMAGLGVYAAARALISGITLPGDIAAGVLDLRVDLPLLGFALVVTLLTGLLVGLAPAWQASRSSTAAAIKDAAATRGSSVQAMRGALVTAQVAAGLVLLVGTGLFLRALTRALSVDLGFRAEHLAVLAVDPGLAQLSPQRAHDYYVTAAERAGAVPGVTGVTWVAAVPLTDDSDRESAVIEGYRPAAGERVRLEYNTVGPRFHDIMSIPLLAGRDFNERDNGNATPAIIINETAAQHYFAGRDPLGAHVTIRGATWTVVGVARDSRYHELNEPARPYAWFPLLQVAFHGAVGAPMMVVRTPGDPEAVLQPVIAAVRSADPAVPLAHAGTMSDRVRAILAPQLAGAWLLGVFSALALVVTAVGIYGVVAYAVSRRTREIGIRMALGARAPSVVRLVVRSNLGFVALGLPIGITLAVALARGMTRFLFGIGPTDGVTLAGTSAFMLLVALTASYIPARRAVRIDPLQALRTDT